MPASLAWIVCPTRVSKDKSIGFFARTPPASILAMNGLVA